MEWIARNLITLIWASMTGNEMLSVLTFDRNMWAAFFIFESSGQSIFEDFIPPEARLLIVSFSVWSRGSKGRVMH